MAMQQSAIIKFGPFEVLTGPYCRNNRCIKAKTIFMQTKMNWLLSDAIMNSRHCRRVILTHIRISKRVLKVAQYSEVHKFVFVYLKIKHNQMSKGALYRKMMQCGIKLSTKNPSKPITILKNYYLKSTIFW